MNDEETLPNTCSFWQNRVVKPQLRAIPCVYLTNTLWSKALPLPVLPVSKTSLSFPPPHRDVPFLSGHLEDGLTALALVTPALRGVRPKRQTRF